MVAGAAAALLVPLLLLIIGLIAALLDKGSMAAYIDAQPGGIWVQPVESIYQSSLSQLTPIACLTTLVSVAAFVAGLLALALFVLGHFAFRSALDTVTRLQLAVHTQAFQLGMTDMLWGRKLSRQQLIVDSCGQILASIQAWRYNVPFTVLLAVSTLAVALTVHFWLTGTAVLVVVLIIMFYRAAARRIKAESRIWKDRAAQQLSMILEQLRQVPLVTSYLLPTIPGDSKEDSLSRYNAALLRDRAGANVLNPLLLLLLVTAAAGMLLLLAGFNILKQPPELTMGGLFVLVTAWSAVALAITRMYSLRTILTQGDDAAAEIFLFLDRQPSLDESPGATAMDPVGHKIEIDAVTVADGLGRKLLDDVSLLIQTPTRIALMATDSRVPRAVAGLLVRFIDPAAGRVLFDGRDGRLFTIESVRAQTALAPQHGMLFTGTVQENILGNDTRFSSTQLIEAAKRAAAYDFIQRLPQGFDTIVGEHGMSLDQGQAFRIGLARAALRDPAILVVEEPEDDLDPESAGQVGAGLSQVAEGRTLIISPSRVETLREVDQIVLIDEGRLAAAGTHNDLLHSSELYRHLHYMRFNEFRD